MPTALIITAGVAVLVGLLVEQRRFARSSELSPREAAAWSLGWLLLSAVFAASVAVVDGKSGPWATAYLIERSLSLDNVFLFSLLLGYFSVPAQYRGRVIAFGVIGALTLRGLTIIAGLALIDALETVVYAFGLLLLYVAYRALRGGAEEADPAANPVLRLVARSIPTTDGFRGRRLLVREDGQLHGTPLLLPVIAIVLADVVFAIDSIPAAFAVTRDAGVIWTANAFALLGLGALLALVEILVLRFRYLDKTIALILAFVGAKILADGLLHIGDVASLSVITGLLAAGVVVSLAADRWDPPQAEDTATRRPPRCPDRLVAGPAGR